MHSTKRVMKKQGNKGKNSPKQSIGSGFAGWRARRRRIFITRPKLTLPIILFLLSLFVYFLVRIIGLVDFPIYFFTDEAAQTVLAQDFLRDHFKNYVGEFFPTYFENGGKYNLGLSVYAQIIPLLLFGRSVFVTRFVSILFSLLAAIAIGITLRDIVKIKHWWVGVIILSMTPAWFLHSRTAFETAMAVSLYAVFICLYLFYRFRDRKYLFPALLMGGLAFYTYSSMQPVVIATGLLLLILDSLYHFKGRWITVAGAGEVILLSLPYIRHVFGHPYESYHQLAMLGSYWVDSISFTEKIRHFLSGYFQGLNPVFWYGNDPHELVRHVMLNYGHLPRLLAPFLAVGLVYAILKLKDPLYRLLFAIILVAPVGAAIVQLGITRILVLVIPATVFTAIGLSICMDWVSRLRVHATIISLTVFIALACANIWMLVDALQHGKLWFSDYSLSGMQYGARQIFPAALAYLHEHPEEKVILSPSWANGTDVVARFMLFDPLPIELGSIDGYFNEYHDISDTTFIMIPDEYMRVLASGKFSNIKVQQILDYPDGNAGFYFVTLDYAPGIMERLEAEKEARRVLIVDQFAINGIQTEVHYSMLDMGVIGSAFDGDNETVIRTLEANPFVIDLDFQEKLQISRVIVLIGGATSKISLFIELEDGSRISMTEHVAEESHPREVIFDLANSAQATFLRIEIESIYDPEPAHVHLWEVTIE